jgi:hypothetical protein
LRLCLHENVSLENEKRCQFSATQKKSCFQYLLALSSFITIEKHLPRKTTRKPFLDVDFGAMGLVTILKKSKRKEKELRILLL